MIHKQLFNDPNKIPNEDFFAQTLNQQLFQVYKEIQKILDKYGLLAEWRYYKDGKSWLCKVTNKKKTIVWISLWENCFKTSFYFTEKTRLGIEKINIESNIKLAFLSEKPTGKLIPLILDINDNDELDNFERIIEYKLSLK